MQPIRGRTDRNPHLPRCKALPLHFYSSGSETSGATHSDLGGLVKTQLFGPHLQNYGFSRPRFGLRICLPNKFSGDAQVASMRTTRWEALSYIPHSQLLWTLNYTLVLAKFLIRISINCSSFGLCFLITCLCDCWVLVRSQVYKEAWGNPPWNVICSTFTSPMP